MRAKSLKTILHSTRDRASILLLASECAFAQTVSLTAAATSRTLPDGQAVPMWGYTCGCRVDGDMRAVNPNAGTGWSPVVITVPAARHEPDHQSDQRSAGCRRRRHPDLAGDRRPVGRWSGHHGYHEPAPRMPPRTLPGRSPGSAARQFNTPPQGPRVQSFATEVARPEAEADDT